MQVISFKIRPMRAPRESLKEALMNAEFDPREGDIIAISSKVVSIDEGRCVPLAGTDKKKLVQSEAYWFLSVPHSKYRHLFTIAKGILVGSAGIDESNGSDHYVLYPKDPFASAKRLRRMIMKEYGLTNIAVIITDSTSMPLRRGAIGIALAWDGIDPLRDYRGTIDLFGRCIRIEMANLIDGLAAAAVLEMGEGNECTPVAIIRGAKNISFRNRPKSGDQLMVAPEDDLFAPLLWNKKWKKGDGKLKGR